MCKTVQPTAISWRYLSLLRYIYMYVSNSTSLSLYFDIIYTCISLYSKPLSTVIFERSPKAFKDETIVIESPTSAQQVTVAVGPQALLRHRRHRIHRRRFPGCVFFPSHAMENLPKKTKGIWRGIYQSIPPQKKGHYSMMIDWENHRFFFMRRQTPIWDLADRTSFLPTNRRVCWHLGTLYPFVDPRHVPIFIKGVGRLQPI